MPDGGKMDPMAFLAQAAAPQAATSVADEPKQDPYEFLGLSAPSQPTANSVGAPAAQPQNQSWTRLPEMAASSAVQGLATGVGMPGDLARLAENTIGTRYAPNFTKSVSPTVNALLPSSQQLVGLTDAAGLTNRPELTPGLGAHPELEKYGSAIVGGAASALPMALLGGGALGLAATGAAGGAGAQAASEYLPNNPYAPAIAGAAAGLATGGIVGAVGRAVENSGLRTAAQVAEQQNQAAQQALAAAKDDLATTKLMQPGNLADIRQKSQAALTAQQQAAQAANSAAGAATEPVLQSVRQKLGASQTLQEAGAILQDHARDWLTNVMPEKMSELWGNVDSMIPKETTVPRNNLAQALQSLNVKGGSNQELIDAFGIGLPKGIQKIVEGGLDNLPEQSWQDAQRLRTYIGSLRGNPAIAEAIPKKNLAALYSAQTADMQQALENVGPQAQAAFAHANEESSKLFALRNGPIAKIVSGPNPSLANDPAPGDVAAKLLSGASRDGTTLGALREAIPGAVDELAAAHLSQPKAWTGLAPEAKAQLVPDVADRQALDNAFALRAQTEAANAAALASAKADHSQTMAKALADARNEILQKSLAVRDLNQKAQAASAATAEAKAALPAKSEGLNTKDIVHSLMGPEIGSALGALGHSLVPGLTDLQGGAAGLLVGAAAPLAGRAIKNIVKNPSTIRYPIGGALGASQVPTIVIRPGQQGQQ